METEFALSLYLGAQSVLRNHTENSCVQLYLSWNFIPQHSKIIINFHEDDTALWRIYKPRFTWIL